MKMKRVLACALSAAMIVTFVSFGNMGVGMVHACCRYRERVCNCRRKKF